MLRSGELRSRLLPLTLAKSRSRAPIVVSARILAIDTSTDWCGIAFDNSESVAEQNWQVGRHGTTAIAPVVAELLGKAGLGVSDFDACAVAIGPGSFSGLRVGISLAKGFAAA